MSASTPTTRDWRSERLGRLPQYLFVEIQRRKQQALAAGRDVIDFGVGDPDQPTPTFIVERMAEAIRDPVNHQYPFRVGGIEFQQAAADYFQSRFGVALDPNTEVLPLIGSKDGLGHLPLAVVNPGQAVIVPQPGFPAYQAAAVFAGATPYPLALSAERGWLPDLESIPVEVLESAGLFYLNYPNNPTGACAPLEFFEDLVSLARQHDILIAHDAAYADVYFGDPPPSILQVPGAAEVAVELHSLSKTFSMTGWRVGFAVGNASALAALAKVKSNVDSGQFHAVRQAACEALRNIGHPEVRARMDSYRRRRDLVVGGLKKLGLPVAKPEATFYVWARCPDGHTSIEFATRMLEEAAVVVIPGIGFGQAGEGYVRLALTVDERRSREAIERMLEVQL